MKKFLAILVSLTMVCAILTGCKDDNGGSTKSKKISFDASTAKYEDLTKTIDEIKSDSTLTTETVNFTMMLPDEALEDTESIDIIESIFGDVITNNKMTLVANTSIYTFGANNQSITYKMGNVELKDILVSIDGVTYVNVKEAYGFYSAIMELQTGETLPAWSLDAEYAEFNTLSDVYTTISESINVDDYDLGEYTDDSDLGDYDLGDYTDDSDLGDYDLGDYTDDSDLGDYDLGDYTDDSDLGEFDLGSSLPTMDDLNPQTIMQILTSYFGNTEDSALPEYMVNIINALSGDIANEAISMFEEPLTETGAIYADNGYYMVKFTNDNFVTNMKALVESLKSESPAVAKKAIEAISSINGLPADITAMIEAMDDEMIDSTIDEMFADLDDDSWMEMQTEMDATDFEVSFGYKLSGTVGDETINCIFAISFDAEGQQVDMSGEMKTERVDQINTTAPDKLLTEDQLYNLLSLLGTAEL